MKRIGNIVKNSILGLGLGCGLGIFGVQNVAANDEVSVSDIAYFWNFADKKCSQSDFEFKRKVIYNIRNNFVIVDHVYTNDAGKMTRIIGQYEDKSEYEILLMSNYGECRFFEDLIINEKDVKAGAYAGIKDPSLKKGK